MILKKISKRESISNYIQQLVEMLSIKEIISLLISEKISSHILDAIYSS